MPFTSSFPDYAGPYRVSTTDIEIPVPRQVFGTSHLANDPSTPALVLETALMTLYYPTSSTTSPQPHQAWLERPLRSTAEGYARFLKAPSWLLGAGLWLLLSGNNLPAFRDGKLARRKSENGGGSSGVSSADGGSLDKEPEMRETTVDDHQDQQFPVIVFSHGLGGGRATYSQLCGELASRGYIVAAIEHRDGTSPATTIHGADGEVKHVLKYYRTEDVVWEGDQKMGFREQELPMRLEEVKASLAILKRLQDGDGAAVTKENLRSPAKGTKLDFSDWRGRLDLVKDITMAGHSFGGATTLQVIRAGGDQFPFVRALAFDPWVDPVPHYEPSPSPNDVSVPLLAVQSEEFCLWPKHFVAVRDIVKGVLPPAPSWLFTLVGSAHLQVSDFPLLLPYLVRKGGSRVDPKLASKLFVDASIEFLTNRGVEGDILGTKIVPGDENGGREGEGKKQDGKHDMPAEEVGHILSGREGGRVKNRAPASIQITAEQLLREAADFQEKTAPKPRQRVEDFEELHEYKGRKRQEFEEVIRRTRANITAWTKYANWEAAQQEFPRSRSVFERALDVEPTSMKLWLSYTEMELKARNISHARNLFDRAVTLLPRIDQIWYKYVYLEEMLGNVAGARQVFERWMAWEPNEKAWTAYIKMEVRYGEFDRATKVYERLVNCHPEPKMFIKWAKFEEERGNVDRAREIFTMGFEFYGQDEEGVNKSQTLYSSFAKMEVRHKEYERARVIYKFALDRLPRSMSTGLYSSFTAFEKQHGDRSAIEATVLGKRRIQYEEELTHEARNYDVWFDYARLEEDAYKGARDSAALERVREVYERAVAQVPPSNEKRHWRRYIFLWLNYALFEELETKDLNRAREIYKACIKLVPHKQFTFAKVWTMFAQFEVRQQDLDAARKIMGTAIGMSPKEKLFKEYIELELQLREFDRCRMLYQKWLEYDASNATAWIKFTELESMLSDLDRARAIYEMAVEQPSMDMPELIWKSWIDLEYEEEEYERTRELYERLLRRTSHVKVWTSYAQFEANAGQATANAIAGIEEEDEDEEEAAPKPPKEDVDQAAVEQAKQDGLERARKVYERGYADLKAKGLKEERVVLLEAWKLLEAQQGDAASLAKVEGMMPRVVKKMRKVDGEGSMMEEYYDMIFADDESAGNPASLKFLELAHAWKNRAPAPAQDEEESEEEESDEDEDEDEGEEAA